MPETWSNSRTVNCPTCNTENPDDAQFCSSCSADLAATSAPVTDADPPDQEQAAPLTSVTSPSAFQSTEFAKFNIRVAAMAIDFVVVNIILFTVELALVPLGLQQIAFGVWPAYFILLTSRYGQTLGKRIIGLRVVDSAGNVPHLRQLVYREVYRFSLLYLAAQMAALGVLIMTWIFFAVLLIGHLAVAYDPLRRAWHDRLGGTYVVRVSKVNYIPPDH